MMKRGVVKTSVYLLIVWSVTLILLGVVGEAFLRWHYFGLPTDKVHRPHPYLQNILDPSVEILPGERLGPFGLRNTGENHGTKQAYKIITIGDSCTFSVASSTEPTSYPTVLEKALIEKFNRDVEVYNAGVPGYNTLQMLLQLHLTLKNVDPDEVIVYGGWNDVNVMRHDRGSLHIENNANGMPKMYRHRTYWELAERVPSGIEKMLSNSFLYNHVKFKITAHQSITDTVDYWQKNGLDSLPDPPLVLPHVIENFRNNIESIIALAQGRGAKVALITLATPMRKRYPAGYKEQFMDKFGSDTANFLSMTPAEIYFYIEAFNGILKQLAETYDVQLYNWANWYREGGDMSMFVDVLHPNDKGYAYLVKQIVHDKDTL